MLSYETKIKLADVLLSCAEHEQQVEVVRQILCEQETFEPYAAFRRIDRNHKGFLTYDNILDFLKDNAVEHPVVYCEALIKKYSKKHPSRLDYIDYLNIVLPQSNSQLRAETAQRPNYDVRAGEYLPVDVEYSLSKVFDRELVLLSKSDDIKYALVSRFDFDPLAAFTTIDQERTDRIDYESLSIFFRSVRITPHQEDIVGCLRRLDKDGDGVLSCEEFCEGLALFDERLAKISKHESPPRSHSKPQMRTSSPTRKLSFSQSEIRTPSRSPKRMLEATGWSQIPKQSPPNLSASIRTTPIKKPSQSSLKKSTSPISRNSPHAKSPILDENHSINQRLKDLNSKLKSSAAYVQILRKHSSPVRASLSTSIKSIPTPKKQGTQDQCRYRRKSPLRELAVNESDSSIKRNGSPFANSSIQSRLDRSPSGLNTRSVQPSPSRRSPNHHRRSNSRAALGNISPIEKDFYRQRSPSVVNETRKIYPQIQIDEKENQSLIHIMKQFILMEKELETSKQDLALRPDFNLLDFFRVFDAEGKGALTNNEVQKGFKLFGVNARSAELYLFMRRFDRDNDGKLKFSEFSDAICPKQSEYSILLNNRTPFNPDLSINVNKLFSAETHKCIERVLRLHLDNELSSESFKLKLQKNRNFNMHQAFNILDQNKDGYITLDELRTYFENQEAFVTDKELKLLLSRLDLNKASKISYSEFVQEFTPKNEHR